MIESEDPSAAEAAPATAGQDESPILETIGPPFGPGFFLDQLGAFVRDRCPSKEEGLPTVEVHLSDGETLDLCHVIGIAPPWVALAVNEHRLGTPDSRMRTELVPYACIQRVTIRSGTSETAHIGFDVGHAPVTYAQGATEEFTPEKAIRLAAGVKATPQ